MEELREGTGRNVKGRFAAKKGAAGSFRGALVFRLDDAA
jgi:hypothetical protein